MVKLNTSSQRIPSNFLENMNGVLNLRVKKGLLPFKEATFPKAIELLTKTEGYKESLKELKFKPEKIKKWGGI